MIEGGKMVKIIVDSTCDLPDELMREYDIKSIPLRVSLGDKEYLDKVEVQVDQVYEAMRNGIVPKTSQPRPIDIYNVFKQYCSSGYDFIYLSFSSKLSGTYQLASAVLKELKEQFGNAGMKIVDSEGGSTATGLIALQAAKLAKAGRSFETVAGQLGQLVQHVEHIFTIADLSWLIKGGRISKAEGIIGNMLNIKPILHVNKGIIEVMQKVRGRKKSLQTIVDILEEKAINFPEQIIGISHTDDLETALELEKMIKERLGERKTMINKIGSVLGSHLGIGGVGVFFFNERPELYME
ncbi:MAG: DegV family protein [Caulobacteraceae bacterium]